MIWQDKHLPAIERWHAAPPEVRAAVLASIREKLGREPRPEISLTDLYQCVQLLHRAERLAGAAVAQSTVPAGRPAGPDRLQRAAGERE